MPDIRDLLRDAADDAFSPLDLDRVKARARQRTVRRRAGLIGAGAIAMVVIVLAGGLFLRRDNNGNEVVVGPTSTTLASGPNPITVPVADVTAVAVGKSSVWVGRGSELVQLDPETFTVRSTAETVAAVAAVAVGHNGVWAAGGDNLTPQGMVSRYDIGTEGMADPNLLRDSTPRSPGAVAIADNEVMVAEWGQGELLRIDPITNQLHEVPLGHQAFSVAIDHSGAWVATEGPLLLVDATNAVREAKVNALWVAASRRGLYASSSTEVFLVDTTAAFESTSAATPLRARGVSGQLAADPQGDGVWVADSAGVTYLRESDGELKPVEGRQLPGVAARDLVADGTYVWIVTADGQLLRWRPPPG